MPERPFFYKKIDDLEILYATHSSDLIFLNKLIFELSKRRNTSRVQDLNTRALNAIKSITQIAPSIATAPKSNQQLKSSGQNTSQAQPKQTYKVDDQPITNLPVNILDAWTALEVLSPPSFKKPEDLASGDREKIANFETKPLPWERNGETSIPNYKLYYQIVLGTIKLETAVSDLLNKYSDNRPDLPSIKGESILALIIVDREGRPVATNSVAISSFAWGLPLALSGKLRNLGQWQQEEKELLEEMTKKITREDSSGRTLPLTKSILISTYNWLVNKLSLENQYVLPPAFSVRSYQYFKLQDPPEPLLLNSFYLDDLAHARQLLEHSRLPKNLKRYLGIINPPSRRNLMEDQNAIVEALRPDRFPLGSWPAKNRNPLVTLQQCAVNLALNDLKSDGILAVNGPPGTGKTTLLRDIVAALISQRAEVLCTYEDPEKAFVHSGLKLKKGHAFIHLYSIDEKLRGYEMIIASSNNKAVENVSAELPGKDAIADDVSSLRYFKTVSDILLQKETWGTLAAVLGNGKNRNEFRKFWWDSDIGLSNYLKHASGTPQSPQIFEGEEIPRLPKIISQEAPPANHEDALKRWHKARANFRKVSGKAESCLKDLQKAFDLQVAIGERGDQIAEIESKILASQHLLRETESLSRQALSLVQEKEVIIARMHQETEAYYHSYPGFWSWLFKTADYQLWKQNQNQLDGNLSLAQVHLETLKKESNLKLTQISQQKSILQQCFKTKNEQTILLQNEQVEYRRLSEQYHGLFVTDSFFKRAHGERHMASPWIDATTAKLRHDVFEAAINLHKSFIDAAAKPIRHNLNILFENFGMNSLGDANKDALIPHLWSTLFMVVPVVSTTFASVSRMFCKIGPENFGWLLVDEAGQAQPQAVVGALLRTQKAVVVGDPIQIEPVVTLPAQLTESLCRQFGIDPLIYNAPSASV